MSIQLDLEDHIAFERPLTRIVRQNVVIHNPHGRPVAFKVKTTAPKLYCVRPNSDIIPPNGSMNVQIMLQAFKEEPPLDIKCRDKFLILSTFLNEVTGNMGLHDLWAYVEDKEKATIHQRKLRCLYVNPVQPEPSNTQQQQQQQLPQQPVIAEPQPVQLDNEEGNVDNTTATTTTTTTNDNDNDNDVQEKMKRMEEELDRYKKQVEELREPPKTEKQVQSTPYPISLFILLSLFVVAVAYFIQFSH